MRLIDADKLKQAIPETKVDVFENCGNCTCLTDEQVKELIDDAPTIEALKELQPQKGEWVVDEYEIYHCPFCGAINNTVYKCFCPNCGADMRKGR